MTLDPIENSGAPGPQHRQILGQKQQAERKHPDAEDRQEGKETTKYQQQARGNAEPAAGQRKKRTVAANEVGSRSMSFSTR